MRTPVFAAWMLVLVGCGGAVSPAPEGGVSQDAGVPDAGVLDAGNPLDTVVDVPSSGPYGTRTFPVYAATNWVNTGLYLHAGEQAQLSATGSWTVEGISVGPGGSVERGMQRGCVRGSLVARTGLGYEGALTCIGTGATFTAAADGPVFVGMIDGTDLGEAYADRLLLSGALEVTVTSTGQTVPTVARDEVSSYPFAQVSSGWVELQGRHVTVTVPSAQVVADLSTAQASLDTLDAVYAQHALLRGMVPFNGQRVRFYPDPAITGIGYMLAGNPIRCVPELMEGGPDQRILRASVPTTDVWGFAHELGHVFSFANGAWVFQYVSLESWPNVFTLHALDALGRNAHQPNVTSYCNGRDAYLASGTYDANFRDDPFLQLCFLMTFTEQQGWPFWYRFWEGMNGEDNEDVGFDGNDVDRSVWSYVRSRFTLAAGADATATFQQWRVPVR